MLFEDTYKTIDSFSRGLYKEKGSKFIGLAYPISLETEVKDILAGLRKEHHGARHFCFAYQLGFDKSAHRFNDDGEPSGSAGKPIFGQILSNDLTNILIVVIRYFGGTKLGISGLINAYRTAAADAIHEASIKTKTIKDVFEVNFDYVSLNNVMKIIKEEGVNQISHIFELECNMKLEVRKKSAERVYQRFSKINNLKINYLQTI